MRFSTGLGHYLDDVAPTPRGFIRFVRARNGLTACRKWRTRLRRLWELWLEYTGMPPKMRGLYIEMHEQGLRPSIDYDEFGRVRRIDFSGHGIPRSAYRTP